MYKVNPHFMKYGYNQRKTSTMMGVFCMENLRSLCCIAHGHKQIVMEFASQ